MYLGIDVGGTKVAAGLVAEDARIEARYLEPLQQQSASSAVEQLTRLIGTYGDRSVRGIGVGVPGIADAETGTVWAPNVRGWKHIPLQSALQDGTPVPVVVESDRNTAVMGEFLYGSAAGLSDVVFLILGTGIGAGILSGGRLIRGAHQIAGAVGWIPVSFRGADWHFEEVAAGPGIERWAELAETSITLEQFGSRGRRGDREVARLFAEVGDAVGRILSILVSVLNPEIIIVGGGVSQLWDLLEPTATVSMHRWSQPLAAQKVKVVVSSLGADAGILGAAAVARQQVEGDRE